MPFTFDDIIGHSAPISWLRRAIQYHRLAHAYLFTGEAAIGKRLTAIRFAQAINCDQSTEESSDACGNCQSCHQIVGRTHPDFLVIQPDHNQSQNPQIRIERIREIEHHVIYRPLIGKRKICLIDEADRLTGGAVNALLKTLEEPPDHSLFLLITSRSSALLPTIRSRCLTVRFSPPLREEVESYLTQHRNLTPSDARTASLLTGLRLGEAMEFDLEEARVKTTELFSLLSGDTLRSVSEIFNKAEMLSKAGQATDILTWFMFGLRDLLLLSAGCERESLIHQEHLPKLQSLAQRTSPQTLLNIINELQTLEQGIQRNVNVQLGLERFLFHLREELFAPS